MTPNASSIRAVALEREPRLQQCGVALSADLKKLMRSANCTKRLHGQLVELLRAGTPVALRVRGLPRHDAVRHLFDACRSIADSFGRYGIDPARLELTVSAGAMPLRAAWRIRRTVLGDAPLTVMFDTLSLDEHSPAGCGARFWHDLWRLRRASVRSAFCPTVRSACPLLSPERGSGVVPCVGLQAPEQSAWLRAEFDLAAFAGDDGRVDVSALTAAIEGFMDAADRAYDTVPWATPVMQHDAWYNRRLAIALCGIGDVARLQGLDPERHASIAALRELIVAIRLAVETRSRSRAMQDDRLPSIMANNPCLRLPGGSRETCWRRHWQDALERHALRHRNLIVLSPWSMFPRADADFRYANLLPLLALADACEFRRNVSLDSWTVSQLKLFHCRAWALNNAIASSAVVADQP